MRLSNYLNLLGVVVGVLFFSMFTPSSHGGVIKKGDTLFLSLKGVPAAEQAKVNGEYRVRDSGNIRVPIINVNIRAVGRRPEDVERSIEAAFKKAEIYVAPTISIQVKERGEVRQVVIVGGQVRHPGRVQYREGMTLMEALQQAGGRGTFASKYFYLTRKDKSGKLKRHKYNYNDAKTHALKVYPNDVINVPLRGPGIRDKG